MLVLLLLNVPVHAQTKSADFNGDLKVNFTDFVLFAQEFGKALSPDAPKWVQNQATNTGPSARFYHTLSLDPKRNRLLVFGGPGSLADTWSFDVVARQWTLLAVEGDPPSPRKATTRWLAAQTGGSSCLAAQAQPAPAMISGS